MATPHSAWSHFAQYVAVRFGAAALQCFSYEQNAQLAATLGSLYFRRGGTARRERTLLNIATSLPDRSRSEVEAIAERSVQHLFQLVAADAQALPRHMNQANWSRHTEIGDLRGILEHMIRGKPTILVAGHFGNWEVVGHLLGLLDVPLAGIARPLDNPYLNRWLLQHREMHGTKVITKWGAIRQVQQILEASGRVGIVADQDAGDNGLFVPFMGRLASSYKSIGVLAMHQRAPIYVGYAMRLRNAFRFRVQCQDVITPDEWEQQPDPLFYITARYNHAIEQMIHLAPEQYFWLYRRWRSRPKHERAGKPLPKSYIAKLESLPWMTQDELDRIVATANDLAQRQQI